MLDWMDIVRLIADKKIPSCTNCTERDDTVDRGSTLIVCYKPLIHDDNGITGPDWGHSEAVFRWFLIRYFQQMYLSLDYSAPYSSRLRVVL